MIRPNELSDPGERAAWTRVEALFEELDALGPSALMVSLRRSMSEDERDELLDRAEDLADALGRGELLDAATKHVEAALSSRLAGPVYRYASGSSSPEDLAAIVRALRDLVVVTIVEDRLVPDDADRLGAAGRFILGIDGPDPAPAEPPTAGVVIPEPSEADWAEAADGPAAVDSDASPVGSRGTAAGVIRAAGFIVAIGLLVAGVAGSDLLLGSIGAIVALLVAKTLARLV